MTRDTITAGHERMGSIIKGPHIKTLIEDADEQFVMIEPLQFIHLRAVRPLNNAMIRRREG